MLSGRDQEVLLYMQDFYSRNDQLPPCTSIARHFGWNQISTGVEYQRRLEREGLIEKNEIGKYRFKR